MITQQRSSSVPIISKSFVIYLSSNPHSDIQGAIYLSSNLLRDNFGCKMSDRSPGGYFKGVIVVELQLCCVAKIPTLRDLVRLCKGESKAVSLQQQNCCGDITMSIHPSPDGCAPPWGASSRTDF